MFYMLYGKDNFSLQQKLREIKQKLGSSEMLTFNTRVLDGQRLSLSELIAECNTAPFLCPVRLVIVEGLLGRFEQKPRSRQKSPRSKIKLDASLEEWMRLPDYIRQMPETTVLVLVDGELSEKKSANRLLHLLAPLAKVMRFPPFKDDVLREWIQNRVKQSGGTISAGAVKLLIDLVGADLWAMSNEIDKLITFSSGQAITEDSVREATSYAREANIFFLVDAILEGRRKSAQQLLYRLLREGVASTHILALVAHQLRLIVMAKELGRELLQSEIRSGLESTSNYSLEQALKQARQYTFERIKSTYHKILEADLAIKSGKYDGDLALELLVAELCKD